MTGDLDIKSTETKTGDSQVTVGILEGSKRGFRSNFLKRSRRTKIIILISSAIVLATLSIFIFLFNKNREVYIIVGNRAITKFQFKEAKQADASYLKAIGNEEGYITSEETIRERLIFNAALENEASKANIKIDQSEVDSALAVLARGLPPDFDNTPVGSTVEQADKVRRFQSIKFGWSDEYSNRTQRAVLLKNKMRVILRQKSVNQLTVPFDTQNVTQIEQLVREKMLPIVSGNQGFKEMQDQIMALSSTASLGIYNDVNKETSLTSFSDESWVAIGALEENGDVSDVIKSSDGNFYVYRLIDRSDGQYISWEDFSKQSASKAKIISSNLDWHRLLPLRIIK